MFVRKFTFFRLAGIDLTNVHIYTPVIKNKLDLFHLANGININFIINIFFLSANYDYDNFLTD